MSHVVNMYATCLLGVISMTLIILSDGHNGYDDDVCTCARNNRYAACPNPNLDPAPDPGTDADVGPLYIYIYKI